MAVRTIAYTVTANGVTPATVQRGGVQGEHRATKLSFSIDSTLYTGLRTQATDGRILKYRFDAYNSMGGVIRGEAQELPNPNSALEYLLENSVTRFGGKIRIHIVITLIQADETEMELLSFPALLDIKGIPSAVPSDDTERESLTTLSEAAKTAKTGAETAEGNAETAQVAAETAQSAAEAAQEAAENARDNILASVDQTYDATSENAQSGVAVAEAVMDLKEYQDDVFDIILSPNLLNLEKTTDSKRLNSSGTLEDDSGYFVTDYIPIAAGQTLRQQFTYNGIRYDNLGKSNYTALRTVCAYNSNKEYIVNSYEDGIETYSAPAETAFIRTSFAKSGFDQNNFSDRALIISDSAEVLPYSEYGTVLSKRLKAANSSPADQIYSSASQNAQSGVAIASALNEKVDKDGAKVLSDNNYSTEEKNKLSGIQAGAQVNGAVDQIYDAVSENAQSGTAVAGALAEKQDKIGDVYVYDSNIALGVDSERLDLYNLNDGTALALGHVATPINDDDAATKQYVDESKPYIIDGNIIPIDVIEEHDGKYWYVRSGNIVAESGNYNAYKIPVREPSKTYYFSSSRFTYVTNEIGTVINSTEYDGSINMASLTNPKYLYVSLSNASDVIRYISVDSRINYIDNYIAPFIKNEAPLEVVRKSRYTSPFLIETGYSSAKGMILNASMKLVGTNDVVIELKDGANNVINSFTVTSSQLQILTRNSGTVAVNHGLTLANNLQINLIFKNDDTVTFRITSNGESFSHTATVFVIGAIRPWLRMTDANTSIVFSRSFTDINKDIWIFGDSYLTNTDSRWMYYFLQSEFKDNILINGYSGCTSTYGMDSLLTLLKVNRPKYIVWCLGMNDGTDNGAIPSSVWQTNINRVIDLCKKYGTTPILTTTPSVPGISHEAKNAWVRSSGYRYVDFAASVGASSSGVWFSGMLSNDNVHPTSKGAKALLAQVLTDFPQITNSK